MTNNGQKLFMPILSNAGGEGKTALAQMMQALLQLKDEPVVLLDGDAGNLAAKLCDETALVVGWGAQAIQAPEIVRRTAGSNVILDLGANCLASAREIVDLLPALREHYKEAGYRAVALLPASTNKIGAVDALKQLGAKLSDFEKLFVSVNRDGSNNFIGTMPTENSVNLGHLQPGFQAFVRQHNRGLAATITNPPQGFHLAARVVGAWMRDFADQPEVRALIGPMPSQLAQAEAPQLSFVVHNVNDARDEALRENVQRSKVLRLLSQFGYTARGLRHVADLMETADAK